MSDQDMRNLSMRADFHSEWNYPMSHYQSCQKGPWRRNRLPSAASRFAVSNQTGRRTALSQRTANGNARYSAETDQQHRPS